jgi:hypothetical protein
MATATLKKNGTIVVSALNARSHFGKLLRDYVKLAAPEPEVLKIIGMRPRRIGPVPSPRARSIRSSKRLGRRRRRRADAVRARGHRY